MSNITSPVSPGVTDVYNDFDNPATRNENIDHTFSELTADFSKVLDIVKKYEKLTNVVVDGIGGNVDNTNGSFVSKVRNLIGNNNDMVLKHNDFLNDALDKDVNNIVFVPDNNDERVKEDGNNQYNDYNDRDIKDQTDKRGFQEHEAVHNEQIALIEDILSKYCRESVTEFERNLKKDAYYNTLRSVLKLFVKEMEFSRKKSNGNTNIIKINSSEQNQSELIEVTDKKNRKYLKSSNLNNENEVFKPESSCEDLRDQKLETMKPLIHRINELVVDNNDIFTVQMNLVTNNDTALDDNDQHIQKSVANIIKDIDAPPMNYSFATSDFETLPDELGEDLAENSSKNDKVVVEYLLKNKLKEEINRVNSLIDKLNMYNTSAKYEHIQVEQNASLHDLVETFRRKRSKSEEDYIEKEARKGLKKGDQLKPVRPMKGTGKPETASKEKYYYPKWPTYDPGDELWKQVKRDYETDPKVRKVVDTSYIHEEKFNSKMWACKEREWEQEVETPKKRKKRETKSEAEYYDREYVRKMKADHKKRVLDDESPETTEGTTMDTRFLDISRSVRKGGPIDIKDLGLSNPSEFVKRLKKRDLANLNKDDVFEWYDPADSNFVEDIAKHARRRRHAHKHADYKQNRQGRVMNGGILIKKIRQALDRHRRRRDVEARPHLSQENVGMDKLDYDMYHGLKYGVTEVAEENLDLTGMYTRYTAASVGPYQKKRYEAFRKYFLAASSTFRDPFIKVSFAVCPFCGDYFGNNEKMQFHQNYMHFNIFSTVVPVTQEPTSTVRGASKDKDMNDIFEGILKDADLACASEKWGEYIDQNINPTKMQEYKNLLFNESVTAFLTVPVHLSLEDPTTEFDENVKVLGYPSEYHEKQNWTYPKDLLKSNKKSIPVVNLYENPEEFMKKLINNEPLLPEEEQERQAFEKLKQKSS